MNQISQGPPPPPVAPPLPGGHMSGISAPPPGTCPLCRRDTRGRKMKTLYGWSVCTKCVNGFANRRQGAWIIDGLLLRLLVAGWGPVIGILMGPARGNASEAGFVGALLGWVVAYLLWCFKDGFWGRSPGKVLCGVEVIDERSGEPIGFGTSFKRNVPMLVPFLPLVAGVQMMKGHRIGDGWSDSKVVWRKYRAHPVFGSQRSASVAYGPSGQGRLGFGEVSQGFLRQPVGPVMGVILGAVAFTGYVLFVGGPSFRSGDRARKVETELQKNVLFRELKVHDPSVYSAILAHFESAVGKGHSISEATAFARGEVSDAIRRDLPTAAADALVTYFSVLASELESNEKKDLDMAYASAFPNPKGGGSEGKPPSQAMIDAMASVIRTAGSHAAGPAESERANQLLKEVMRPLLPTHGDGLRAIATPYASGVDRRGVLRALIAAYHAILGLPVADAGAVLRHLSSSVKK